MIKVGQFNKLRVVKEVPFGIYLDGDDWGDILLPNKVVPKGTKINDVLSVFIYFDSEDKIIATTLCPKVQSGGCAFLMVIDVNRVGAFLDWGLDKDLLAPIPEQQRPMEKDRSYIVYVKQDNKGRLIASSKLDHHLDNSPSFFNQGDEINILIAEKTDLGTKVIINDSFWGLIHTADIFQTLSYGKRTTAYVKRVREDGKIDVTLRKTGQDNIRELATRILLALNKSGGFLGLHDKSTSLEIQQAFGESKKSFKSAIGQLYKQGAIIIEASGIRLSDKSRK
ncbi:MAG: S1-like domain-containing RNA-binding protein [Legionella sp.]|nr:S1-like domain-containing RNA-binding protein [Legionella sp.]